MKSSTPFTEKYATALIVGTALFLMTTLFAVERFQMLPLQGAATPMYGSMPSPVLRKKAVSSKPSQVVLRKALRKNSQASSRGVSR